MERDGLVTRTVYASPTKVEYRSTDLGGTAGGASAECGNGLSANIKRVTRRASRFDQRGLIRAGRAVGSFYIQAATAYINGSGTISGFHSLAPGESCRFHRQCRSFLVRRVLACAAAATARLISSPPRDRSDAEPRTRHQCRRRILDERLALCTGLDCLPPPTSRKAAVIAVAPPVQSAVTETGASLAPRNKRAGARPNPPPISWSAQPSRVLFVSMGVVLNHRPNWAICTTRCDRKIHDVSNATSFQSVSPVTCRARRAFYAHVERIYRCVSGCWPMPILASDFTQNVYPFVRTARHFGGRRRSPRGFTDLPSRSFDGGGRRNESVPSGPIRGRR